MATYEEFKTKATLLKVVQRQLDMAVTPFPELTLTGEDLGYLSDLYDTYQRFIDFDEVFKEKLWAEVDLKKAIGKVRAQSNTQELPPRVIYNFHAYVHMWLSVAAWAYKGTYFLWCM